MLIVMLAVMLAVAAGTRLLIAVTSLAEHRAPWTNLFPMAASGRGPADIRTRVSGGLKLPLQEQCVFLPSWMGL